MSVATFLWTLHTAPVVFIQTSIVMTRQQSQAMTAGQINVLVWTQLYGSDELKWTGLQLQGL